jgi:transcriptional regulator with XRE-family HTH domain
MPKYNIFEDSIDSKIKKKHEILMAQTRALFDASNILSEAMNSTPMTQKELSKHLGISKGYVSRLLSGSENISLKNLSKILYQLDFELKLSSKKIIIQKNDDFSWSDSEKSNSNIKIKCSVLKKQSSWSDLNLPKVACNG